MSRIIRRVPADWEHPRHTAGDAPRPGCLGAHRPLYDQDFTTAAEAWVRDFMRARGDAGAGQVSYFWEVNPPPDRALYRERRWSPDEATHWQVYAGDGAAVPVTPVFASAAALVDHLVAHGDAHDQTTGAAGWCREAAEALVRDGRGSRLHPRWSRANS